MKFIHPKYEFVCFALLMSFITSMIVSGVITVIHNQLDWLMLAKWFSGAMLAWPIVLVSILLLAPRLQSFVRQLLKD